MLGITDVLRQAEDLLFSIYKVNKQLGAYIKLDQIHTSLGISHDQDKIKETNFLIKDVLMDSLKCIEAAKDKPKYKITATGFKFLHEAFYKLSSSTQAFCALWFNEKTNDLWSKGICPAVQKANYEAKRIDTEHFTEDIIAQMLILINHSKFVVADLTGNRGGVYFEAGYAKARGLPVIFTCHGDAMDSQGQKPHFDVNHYPIITWQNDLDTFSTKLYSRIINILN